MPFGHMGTPMGHPLMYEFISAKYRPHFVGLNALRAYGYPIGHPFARFHFVKIIAPSGQACMQEVQEVGRRCRKWAGGAGSGTLARYTS